MAQMTVTGLAKSYGTESVLEDVHFFVEEKDKIGIIGVNGSGKTTLMRMLIGELEPDHGAVYHRSDLCIGYLRQNVHIQSERSVYEECRQAYAKAFAVENELRELEGRMDEVSQFPDQLEAVMERYRILTERFEELGGLSYQSEIRGVLKGLGFSPERFDQPVNSLSGGEKSRLELSLMLLGRPEVLMLDEPTNHLDASAVDFLESFLRDFRGAILLISHDRYFLDRIVNRIFLVEHGRLHTYDCGYREYSERRKKDLEIRRRAYENQQKEIERQKEIIERLSHLGGSKRKRGISQSRSRQKLLDKMELLEAPEAEQEHMALRLKPKYESGEDVLELSDVGISFEGRSLFENAHLHLRKGEKVALIGDNGAGKTTLFRLILQKLVPDTGRIRIGSAVKIAWFDQEQATLCDEGTVLDEIWDAYPAMTHYEVRAALAKFQFVGEDLFRLVGELSGGEKARLALLKLMLSSANFLMLDEPTNHLDIESREILEEALKSYEGTCLFISHDRYFISHVCDRILSLNRQGLTEYLGSYEDYLEQLRRAQGAEELFDAGETKTQQKKQEKQRRMAQRELRALRAQAQALSQEIARLEEEHRRLEQQSYDPALYEDHERARAHHEQMEAVQKQAEQMTEEWFSIQLQLEEES
ncbi:MAG: ABC-F family ATP-binding cassette domain-containing protein [Ndongobacter sp.]|nr:ABC-F family ATP-binding cassette domain-containing protein [Ndongobacter sp.]